MEIRNYVRILWRWLWLILGLPILVLAFSLLRPPSTPQPGYTADMRFVVGVIPEGPGPAYFTYDRYYAWVSSEYLVDDLTEIVTSREVAEAIRGEAARQRPDLNVPLEVIQESIEATNTHRVLAVTLSAPDQDTAATLSNALAAVLSQGRLPYLEQFRAIGTPVFVHLIDAPQVTPAAVPLRDRIDLPLRLVLGLLGGLTLALFLDYVDDSVRSPLDLQAHGLEVLGTVPRPSSLPWAERRLR